MKLPVKKRKKDDSPTQNNKKTDKEEGEVMSEEDITPEPNEQFSKHEKEEVKIE